MVNFRDLLMSARTPVQTNIQTQEIGQNPYALAEQNGVNPEQVPGPGPAVPPVMIQNIANTVNTFMPALEQITGLTRREIFLNLMKTGLRGGGLSTMLDSLMGARPAPEAKFVRYVKIAAVWVPAAVFLMGAALVGVLILYKLSLVLVGSL